ncbi:gliding motility-associated C-terminal domain-containing protein [Polaribacter sp. Hel1_85]|uniref:gliding motility-associated C-terminal domain-containing protein n=1 Tax=Polaribacter sp. Hel1_85 TaxID=1250005 RepID=UPI00052C164F|nr:T9SS C-terminal target domain-containing protein [Polaribacter sp. Hel1_85]KGL62809.1 hypothetical protein PHEL85_2604 [Polaribacter sp. Hel1_85]
MLHKPLIKIKLIYFIYIFSSIFLVNNLHGQCAGSNNSITICDKELDAANQTFNLFNQLAGTPESGGVWKSDNPQNQTALDTATGIVNLWKINRFGVHSFIYTNSNCNESAIITINLGGYPGEDNINGGANACSTNSSVDLYTFLDNNLTDLNADINGEWEETPTTPKGFLSGQFFNAQAAEEGTYSFTYTVESVDNCLPKFATVLLEVHRAPESGTPENIIICKTEDFSLYTNVNLFDQLTEEDNDGIWEDIDGTNQISDAFDSTINIQEIYNTFGPGDYKYDYTVFQTHGVCVEKTSTVIISIPEIKGQFEVNKQCIKNPILIEILYTNSNNDKITYDLEYEITNANTNNLVYSGTITSITNDPNDVLLEKTSIELPSGAINETGRYKITASKISNVNGVICNSLEILENEFVIYNTETSIPESCFNGTDALITISNLIDDNGEQSNNSYNINYVIEDYINNSSKIVENQAISFSDGTAILPVDISVFPDNAIDYNLTIVNPTENGFECIDFDFSAALIPEDIQLDFIIDDDCSATEIKAVIDAPTLHNGTYTIDYIVSEVDNSNIISKNTIIITGGIAKYDIDISNLTAGNYKVILESVQDDVNTCRTEFEFKKTAFFSIKGHPDAPSLDANQSFCLNSTNAPKISDIVVSSGENLIWYEDNTTLISLDIATLLIDGEDYFVSSSNTANGCESEQRSSVVVKINKPSLITSSNTSPAFCAIDNVSIANLDAVAKEGNILWYDSLTGGNLLNTTTVLENGKNYFAVESIDGCEFNTRLQFNVNITSLTKPTYTGSNSLCSLDNLSLFDFQKNINADINSNLIWYDSLQGGFEINNSEKIQENVNYYVASISSTSNCESERLLISVGLSECNPENYGFYIPDGFSPNGDSINDLYFIPNIELFYPNYSIEIFNRYGQSIFTGNKSKPSWDGKNNKSGNSATSGVYFYILNYNKDNIKPIQGRIYLSK